MSILDVYRYARANADTDDALEIAIKPMGVCLLEIPASLVECTLIDLVTYLAREEGR